MREARWRWVGCCLRLPGWRCRHFAARRKERPTWTEVCGSSDQARPAPNCARPNRRREPGRRRHEHPRRRYARGSRPLEGPNGAIVPRAGIRTRPSCGAAWNAAWCASAPTCATSSANGAPPTAAWPISKPLPASGCARCATPCPGNAWRRTTRRSAIGPGTTSAWRSSAASGSRPSSGWSTTAAAPPTPASWNPASPTSSPTTRPAWRAATRGSMTGHRSTSR